MHWIPWPPCPAKDVASTFNPFSSDVIHLSSFLHYSHRHIDLLVYLQCEKLDQNKTNKTPPLTTHCPSLPFFLFLFGRKFLKNFSTQHQRKPSKLQIKSCHSQSVSPPEFSPDTVNKLPSANHSLRTLNNQTPNLTSPFIPCLHNRTLSLLTLLYCFHRSQNLTVVG